MKITNILDVKTKRKFLWSATLSPSHKYLKFIVIVKPKILGIKRPLSVRSGP